MNLPHQTGTSIRLTGINACDAYLRYIDIEELLEDFYTRNDPTRRASFLDLEDDDHEQPEQIKPETAFVLMAMNPDRHELTDVYEAIRSVCRAFGIRAYRADDIQHEGRITDVILEEIRTAEYLIADLSLERPNVYYEIGYAHALGKRPILYRRFGTDLHFDLAVHNVPEYKNATDLRDQLRLRFEAILGRKAPSDLD